MPYVPNVPALYARIEQTDKWIAEAAAEGNAAERQAIAAVAQAMATLCHAEATWLAAGKRS